MNRCVWCDGLIAEGVVCASCSESESAQCAKCGHSEFLWSRCPAAECPNIEVIETKTTKQIIADMRKKVGKGVWNETDEGLLNDRKKK